MALSGLVAFGCGKKGQSGDLPPGAAPSTVANSSPSSPSDASGAVESNPANSDASSVASVANGEALMVTGSYESKLAAVRTPTDSPKFDDVTSGALGVGELTFTLPASEGPVVGSGSGALGVQSFSGAIEAGWLSGALRGEGETSMWGFVDATVTGVGASRVVSGTLRVSSGDGRIVREAAFTLKKK